MFDFVIDIFEIVFDAIDALIYIFGAILLILLIISYVG